MEGLMGSDGGIDGQLKEENQSKRNLFGGIS